MFVIFNLMGVSIKLVRVRIHTREAALVRVLLFLCILCSDMNHLSLPKKNKRMITIIQSISGTYFSSNVPDVEFSIGGNRAMVTMTIDDEQIYQEYLYPLAGVITLAELDRLLTPYAKKRLKVKLKMQIAEQDADNETIMSTSSMEADIIYSEVDINTTAQDFIDTHYLTLLEGEKVTSLHRLEYLHYIGTDKAEVTAYYDDGTNKSFSILPVAGNDRYTTLDVSAEQFAMAGKTLLCYDVQAGKRTFRFTIDFAEPDCAPVLVFDNSFGVEELIYCTGTHTIAPSYKREQAYIGKTQRNYAITETRVFKADTGILSFAMANWVDELFRSMSVRIVTFKNGNPNVGKEVIITDSKSEYDNKPTSLPRFSFSYQYAQRNHNVLNLERVGRIFDNTFDNTFE